MKQKSLGANFIYNTLKTLLGVVFPLISFPYVSRVLGPDGLGKVDYSQAVITYFILIASFGIAGYAVREGARLRDDREKLNVFCGEILAINLVTVCIAYAAFLIALLLPAFAPYRELLLLFSVSIVLTVIGMEWLYNIFEEYRYITVRSFIFQLISLCLLLTLVRKKEDYLLYAVILVFSGVGSNVLNFIRARKYIRVRFLFSRNLMTHVKPMCMIFIMTVASSVYLVMDRTMLGYITGNDAQVGLYAAAIKVHAVIMSLLTSLRVIMTPRVAYYMQKDPSEADRLNELTMRLAVLFAMPCSAGVFLLSDRILLLLSGNEYLEASLTLKILMVDLILASLNGIIVNQIFITRRKDIHASAAVVIGALCNLACNALTIPVWGKEGAAVSTVVSEAAMFVFVCIKGRNFFRIRSVCGQLLQSVAACVPMAVIIRGISSLAIANYQMLILSICACAAEYFVFLRLLRNPLVTGGLELLKNRLRGKERK